MKIDRYIYSKALAAIRGSDFAHPGEIESIEKLLNFFPDSKSIKVLDYGCGLGGTLDYIRSKGYRNIIGIDIDADSINYARDKYGNGEKELFYTSLSPAFTAVHNNFDLIYSINVFYLITDKSGLLEQLYKISQKGTYLIISDFVYKTSKNQIAGDTTLSKILDYIPHAIHIDGCPELNKNGWTLVKTNDISNDYVRWYKNFVEMIRSNKAQVLDIADINYYNYMLNKYQFILIQLQNERIGGAMILLQKTG